MKLTWTQNEDGTHWRKAGDRTYTLERPFHMASFWCLNCGADGCAQMLCGIIEAESIDEAQTEADKSIAAREGEGQ